MTLTAAVPFFSCILSLAYADSHCFTRLHCLDILVIVSFTKAIVHCTAVATTGHTACVELLLHARNIDVNKQNNKGFVALMLAAQNGKWLMD